MTRAEATTPAPFVIVPAATTAEIAEIVLLFNAYAATLSFNLCFQDFEGELAGLPGRYAPPEGALLLARDANGLSIGCVAMRPLGEGIAEMKRLYVTPEGRGRGVGRALAAAAITAARAAGHREIRLDTLPEMSAAQALYRSFGFKEMPAYYETPVERTIFFRLEFATAG